MSKVNFENIRRSIDVAADYVNRAKPGDQDDNGRVALAHAMPRLVRIETDLRVLEQNLQQWVNLPAKPKARTTKVTGPSEAKAEKAAA